MTPSVVFEVCAYRSTKSNDWCAVNDELPVAAEAPTFDDLVEEVKAQAAEMIKLNRLCPQGEQIEVRLVEYHDVRAPLTSRGHFARWWWG